MLERPRIGDQSQIEDGVSALDREGTPTRQEPLPSYSNPCMVNSSVSRDMETDYSSQDKVRFRVPEVRTTLQSIRTRSAPVGSRLPFPTQEVTQSEPEEDEEAVGRHIENSGITGIFRTLIEEVMTTIRMEMKSLVQYMNEKFSMKLPDKAADPPHPNPQHSTKSRARKVNRSMKSDTRLMGEVNPESTSSEEDDKSHTSSMKTSSIIQEYRYSKTLGANLPPFTGTELWKVWYNQFESVANLNHWDDHEKLQELLRRIQGKAAEFVFEQLKPSITSRYPTLIKEMKGRFDVI
jgi:hypothetical protein